MTANWIISYPSVANHSLEDLAGRIMSCPRHVIGDLTIEKLSRLPDPTVGLYFVFEEGALVYVGKSSSRSFVERIPAHLDIREDGWFNTLPKRVRDFKEIPYDDAHKLTLQLEIVLVSVPKDEPIQKYETILRSYMLPTFNPGKPNRFNDHADQPISAIAQML